MKQEQVGLRVRHSPWFKLKRKPGYDFMAVDFMKGYGFIPQQIIIERDHSRSNVIRVNAVLTPTEIKKEDKKIKELERSRKQVELDRKKLEGKEVKDDTAKQKPASKEIQAGAGYEIR